MRSSWEPGDRPAPADGIDAVAVDTELVIWQPDTHRVHRLDPVAAALWRLLDGTVTVGDLAADVVDVWNVSIDDALRDVCGLLVELERQQLVRRHGVGAECSDDH